jgi:hypothetical protein
MNTKLTLTVEQSIIEGAKAYARDNGRSLSDIVENYLKTLANQKDSRQGGEGTPIVNSLRGSFRAPEGFDYKDELKKKLSEKYL